jgi:hypothetical protein
MRFTTGFTTGLSARALLSPLAFALALTACADGASSFGDDDDDDDDDPASCVQGERTQAAPCVDGSDCVSGRCTNDSCDLDDVPCANDQECLDRAPDYPGSFCLDNPNGGQVGCAYHCATE